MNMQASSNTHLKCTGKHGRPKVRTKRAVIKTQHTHCDRTDLIVAICQKAAVTCMYCHKVTLSRIALDLSDCSREHPWVESEQRLFPISFKYNLYHIVLFSSKINGFFSVAISLRYISRHTHASVAAYLHCDSERFSASQFESC